jgi:hypothetical protein
MQAFDDALGAYIARDPYTAAPEFDPESGWHSIRLKADPPGPHFSLILGEAAHNLRSALDHVAWQLANLDGPPPREDRIQFPILSKPREDFFGHPNVGGMRDEHKTILESLQPYHAGHGQTGLEDLAWINNRDKHRLLHTVAISGSQFVPHFLEPRPGYAIERSEFGYTGVLEHSTEIGRLLVTPKSSELQVNMQLGPFLGVAFGEPGSRLYGFAADGHLKVIAELVEQLIGLFDRPGQSGLPPWP